MDKDELLLELQVIASSEQTMVLHDEACDLLLKYIADDDITEVFKKIPAWDL